MHNADYPIVNAVWSTDDSGILHAAFESPDGLLGIPRGRPLSVWLLEAGVDAAALAGIETALGSGTPFQHEWRTVCGDGHARHLLVTGIAQQAGTPWRFSGAVVDLTAHRHAIEAAMRSAAEHRLIIDHSDDLIAHSDTEGRYVHVSSSYTRLMGWHREDMIGQRVIDFLHPDDRAGAHRALAHLVGPDARVLVTEVRKQRQCGDHIALSTKACPIIDPATGRSEGVVLVSRDITEERAMRRQLEEMANEKLALVESIHDGFFSVNADWEVTYINERAAAFVGASRGSVLGKRVWDAAPGLAASAAGVHLRHAMTCREHICVEEYYEPKAVWLSGRIYAFADGLSVFFHDITKRKRAEAQLEQLATCDSLTGLPNRSWINRRVEEMLVGENRALTTVFFIDLNRFKEINDSMGHAAGDIVLQQVSERLKKCMRPGDAVARLGGDEFVVAASCQRHEAAVIAERLLGAVRAPLHVHGLETSVGASIGISQPVADGTTVQELFGSADLAMYKAKGARTGGYEFD